MKVIAITGGIGSGKSIVARCVKAMGYPVYDCDSRAKALMDSNPAIIEAIGREIGSHCIDACRGTIDRAALASTVFSDADALARLNAIVHGAVRADIKEQMERLRSAGLRSLAFIETAILYQSEIDRMVDAVWEVTAPRAIRIERVMSRNGLTAGEVEARIDSQDTYKSDRRHHSVNYIVNDGFMPILPAVVQLIREAES